MKLEDFVRENKNEFDDKEPALSLWDKIENRLPIKSRSSLWNSLILWRVAAMLLLGLSIYLFISHRDFNSSDKSLVMREWTDVEHYYGQQISEKVRMISQFNDDGLSHYTQDFQQLEAMYMVLKEQMKVSPSKKVKDALVLNLLIQIDLLNKQLENLEDQKMEESEDKRST